MKYKVVIVIVNWNGLRFLNACFSALAEQTYADFRVIFVDNGSGDSSVQFVGDNFKQLKITIIPLVNNTGFALGNNIGIRKALEDKEVDCIVCLNNDTIVDAHWLEELVKTATNSPGVGMVSSLALFPDNTIHNAGLSLEKGLEINEVGGISIGYGKNCGYFQKEIEIFAPGGMSSLYKRQCVEDVMAVNGEFFDEDFFAYVEDSDVGFMAQFLGWKCIFNPRAKLIHFQSQTLGRASARKVFYIKRNTVLLATKYLSLRDFISFLYYQIALNFNYLNKKNGQNNKKSSKIGVYSLILSIIKGYAYSVLLLPKMLKKRRNIMMHKKVYSFKEWLRLYNRLNVEKYAK
jgi:GT2 family glycosyltransferase